MAQKNNQSNKGTKATNALSQIEALQKQILELQNQAAAEAEEMNNKIKEFINGLPGQLSKITGKEMVEASKFSDLINVIKQVEKGTLGKAGTNGERSYKTLTDADKTNLVNDRKNGMQYSALTAKYGVSASTVFNVCEAAGLTKAREEAKS